MIAHHSCIPGSLHKLHNLQNSNCTLKESGISIALLPKPEEGRRFFFNFYSQLCILTYGISQPQVGEGRNGDRRTVTDEVKTEDLIDY